MVGTTITASLVLPLRADYATDFNNGTTAGWKHFDLTSLLNSMGVTGRYATYTFPPDGRGGQGYRIDAVANPLPGDFGPGRASSYRPETYSRGLFTVDLLDWTELPDVAFGFLFRANDIGPGTTRGYIMNYLPTDDVLQFNTVENEAAGTTLADATILLDPLTHNYRWELSTWGPNLVGRVFQLPDTQNPIASVWVIDHTTSSGVTGLFNYDQQGTAPAGTTVASTTFDNFSAVIPPISSLAALTVELSPTPGSGVHEALPVFKVAVLDRETSVRADSFELKVDGLIVPPGSFEVTPSVAMPSNANPFPGATLRYAPSSRLSAGVHTALVVFASHTGGKQTNEWWFTSDYFTTPAGSGGTRGFQVHLTQANQQEVGLGDSLQRALRQLAPNSPIAALYSTKLIANTINYSQKALDDPPGTDGAFDGDESIPGQMPGGSTDNYALEATCWLDLPLGTTTFGVISDNGFQVTSSALRLNPILGRLNGGNANVQFSAYAEVAGLYPFTLVWYENNGGAHLEWFVVRENGAKILVNTPGAPTAFATLLAPNVRLLAASTLRGDYASVLNATTDLSTKSITVPSPSVATTYYRVEEAVWIREITLSGGNIIIRYE